KLPVPGGMSGNVHVYLYNAATGTFTDMGAALQNGMLIFKTSQVNGCYAVSQISNCFITLDTHEYNMPAAGQYQIGVNLQGAEKRYMKVYSANPAVAGVIKLANGNYTATALSNGQAYIMFDVYDGKGKFLTHASTRINVVVNKKPHGDSKRQVGIFEPKS
ncbi:MAG TPA: hypothetical protein VHO66_09515, partial [Ruminiclostridium sp.]|nr:hypothetical protein [Ruminiclostridium sp.]